MFLPLPKLSSFSSLVLDTQHKPEVILIPTQHVWIGKGYVIPELWDVALAFWGTYLKVPEDNGDKEGKLFISMDFIWLSSMGSSEIIEVQPCIFILLHEETSDSKENSMTEFMYLFNGSQLYVEVCLTISAPFILFSRNFTNCFSYSPFKKVMSGLTTLYTLMQTSVQLANLVWWPLLHQNWYYTFRNYLIRLIWLCILFIWCKLYT